jgi:hypothetical protein
MINAAIVYLLRTTNSDIADIIKSINKMYIHFLIKYKYPIIILIEDDFKDEYIQKILNNIEYIDNIDIKFRNIKFEYSKNIDLNKIDNILITHNGKQKWPLGYRHMCRFWTGNFLDNKYISDFDLIWRMDSDAYINNDINHDVFKECFLSNIDYFYSNITDDEHEVCLNLDNYCKNFFNNLYRWNKYKMFTTHVEIINIKNLKNSKYYDFYKYIDNSDGFYKYRWGDAPIRYIAYENGLLTCQKLNISYFHGNDGSGRLQQIENNK